MPRTFIAVKIEPTPELRKLLGQLRLLGGRLKPVAPHSLHLTLKFLGDTADDIVPQVQSVLWKTLAHEREFEIQLAGLGAFPDTRRPAVAWVGVDHPETLVRIAGTLDAALEPLGFAPEHRPYQPHLTLLRMRTRPPQRLFELFAELESVRFGAAPVVSIELFESRLLPGGARYTVIDSVRLIS